MSDDAGGALVQFVARDAWLAWLAAGWSIADDLAGTHHGAYSILMTRPAGDEQGGGADVR